MRDLSEIREDINKIDDELIELFKKRMDCSREVAENKKANDIPILNQSREDEILASVGEKGGEYGAAAQKLFSVIMELSRDLQHNIIEN